MKTNFGLSILLTVFLIIGCSSEEQVKTIQKETSPKSKLITTVSKILDNKFTVDYNESKDYAICMEEGSPDVAKTFCVYDVKIDSVILKDKLVLGNLEWTDSYLFTVTKFPGTLKKDEEPAAPTYTYNVKERKKQ